LCGSQEPIFRKVGFLSCHEDSEVPTTKTELLLSAVEVPFMVGAIFGKQLLLKKFVFKQGIWHRIY
jgi:hypothetical protein